MDRLDRLNRAARDRSHRNCRPRDAASLVIVDASGRRPRILLGRRHPKQVFVPGKFVFPGGHVDRADKRLALAETLTEAETARLLYDMKGWPSPARARALALAAIRETFEETGLIIGRPGGVMARRTKRRAARLGSILSARKACHAPERVRNRFIPAHAGMNRYPQACEKSPCSVPRTRGDEP